MDELIQQITELKKQKNAFIIAHNYELQLHEHHPPGKNWYNV